MAKARVDYEDRFYFALLQIKSYSSPAQLRRSAAKDYGLTYEESLEMAYENVIGEAISALRGYRRGKVERASGAVDPHATDTGKPTPRE